MTLRKMGNFGEFSRTFYQGSKHYFGLRLRNPIREQTDTGRGEI